jgi:hypothetical protein
LPHADLVKPGLLDCPTVRSRPYACLREDEPTKRWLLHLYLSTKTVGRYVENIYNKIGVKSRAAAAVFAMEHRLLNS